MIVEFIGSTGAGKTTLISEVQRGLAGRAEVITAFESIATPLGLQNVGNPTIRNLIQEFVGFPFFVRWFYRHRTFLLFVLRMLERHAKFTFLTLNYLRSIERTIGVFEILRRFNQDRIVLVDEGTIVPAHNVFVTAEADYSPDEITRYAALAPLPDVIIYVKAPVDTLVQRALARTDPPRELKAASRTATEEYINCAVVMFEQLVTAENVRSRTLIVDNPASDEHGRAEIVRNIVQFLLEHPSADKCVQ